MTQRHHQETHGLIDIKRFFDQPPLQYLGLELAVCWILDCLLEADSYPTALMQRLAELHPKLRLSETVLQQAITFLDQQGAIGSYSQRCPSRGRPRRMLHLSEGYRQEAKELMPAWQQWLQEAHSLHSITINSTTNSMPLRAPVLAR
jgi:DNA-binding PadR family transcriptional regulator